MTALLLSQNSPIDVVDNNGDTPLHTAARNGNVSTMRLLMDAGAALDARSSNGMTLLQRTVTVIVV